MPLPSPFLSKGIFTKMYLMQTAKELCDELGRNDIIPKIPLKDRKDSAEILHKGKKKRNTIFLQKKLSFRERKNELKYLLTEPFPKLSI